MVSVEDNGDNFKAEWSIPEAYRTRVELLTPSSGKLTKTAKIRLLRPGPVVVRAQVGHSIGVLLIAAIDEGIEDAAWASAGRIEAPFVIGGFRVINDPDVLERMRVKNWPISPPPLPKGMVTDFSRESLLEMDYLARTGIGEWRPAVTSISPERIEIVVPARDETRQKTDEWHRFYLFRKIPKVRDDCKIDVITLDSLQEAIRW